MDGDDAADNALQQLSAKQREVLDLVLDRRTNKEIARVLGISVSGVEQRLQAARQRLGAHSRADAARTYERLLTTCGLSTRGKFQFPERQCAAPSEERDTADEVVFSLEDSARFDWAVPWASDRGSGRVLEMLDAKFGVAGRLLAIAAMTLSIAIVALIVLAIANALDGLI